MGERHSSEPAGFTFDQWVQKVFTEEPPDWNWFWQNALNPARAEWLLTYPTRLFLDPDFLTGRFSGEQIRKGLWNLAINWELNDSIWEPDLPWRGRSFAWTWASGPPREASADNDYLRSHPDLPDETRSYAVAAIEGNLV